MRLALLAAAAALIATPAPAQILINGVPPSADVRSMDLALDASGNGTWDVTAGGTLPAFPGVPDVTHLAQAVNTNDYLICNYTVRTATTVAVHCMRINGLAVLLTGLFGGTLLGVKVNLIARYRAM